VLDKKKGSVGEDSPETSLECELLIPSVICQSVESNELYLFRPLFLHSHSSIRRVVWRILSHHTILLYHATVMKIQKKIRPTRANIRLSRHMGKENFTRNPCPFFASSRRSPSSCPSAQTIQPFFRRPPAANKNKDENNRNSISNDGSRNIINYSISQERLDSTRIQTDDNMGRPVATNQKPYFVPHRPGTSDTVRDAGDDGVYVEEVPASVDPDDFAPRLVNMRVRFILFFLFGSFGWRDDR